MMLDIIFANKCDEPVLDEYLAKVNCLAQALHNSHTISTFKNMFEELVLARQRIVNYYIQSKFNVCMSGSFECVFEKSFSSSGTSRQRRGSSCYVVVSGLE